MTKFENQILDIVKKNNGIKASQIADEMECERSKVNSALYSTLSEYCLQDNYKWYYAKKEMAPDEGIEPTDKSLSSLCKYYLNCLSLEQSKGISAALTKDSQEYVKIAHADKRCFTEPDVAPFLQKAFSSKSITAYLGYPIEIVEIYSSKYKKSFKKIEPVFLFPIEYEAGKSSVSQYPIINPNVVQKYTNQDNNSFIYDAIDLGNELGLNSADADFDVEDLVEKLQSIRQWNWIEHINPNTIDPQIDYTEVEKFGIYNGAVIITSEKSPFTIGLESELKDLSELPESRYRDTALYDWIHPSYEKTEIIDNEKVLLEVLPLNTEQDKAIQTALSSKLTIVTGPPGTGKSQVVTDLLINSAWQGKKALFASKNNKAVDVVEARVNGLAEKPILFRLGSDSIAYRFAKIAEGLLIDKHNTEDLGIFNKEREDYADIVNKYKSAKEKKEAFITLRNTLDSIEHRYCDIREKMKPYYDGISEKDAEELSKTFDKYLQSYNAAQKEKQSAVKRLFWFAYQKKRAENLAENEKILSCLLSKYGLNNVICDAEEKQVEGIQSEIESFISDIQLTCEYKNLQSDLKNLPSLENIDKELVEYKHRLAEMAKSLWRRYLEIRQVNIAPSLRRSINNYVSAIRLMNDIDLSEYPDLRNQFKELQKQLAPCLPCWAVTSLSAKGRVPFEAGMFDLVIIDEASQCDIASILPLLYRAKSAVIIGDSKQLSHISSISGKQDANLIQKYEVGFEWSYVANSLYDKAIGIANPENIVSLRDHHRSYGEIINFSNNEFYDGQLRIATNYDKLVTLDDLPLGIRWIDETGKSERPSNGGLLNKEEANRIVSLIEKFVVEKDFKGSVGVVTPFRAQADYIRDIIDSKSNLSSFLYGNNNLWVDTVHKFQGDERDIIFFSPVISECATSGSVAFLKSTGNLFNVAITRARSSLIVVGNMEYCFGCGVPYLEHFVSYVRKLKDNSEHIDDIMSDFGRRYPTVQNEEQVSEWERIFYTALYDKGIKTIPQYAVDKYKLDLAIVDGSKKLDIEIDGEKYHSDWNGELCYRDQLRNQRLFEIGWDVKRFWVYQIRDDLNWCISQVQEWINK